MLYENTSKELKANNNFNVVFPNTRTTLELGSDNLLSVILYSPLRPFRRCFPGFQILQPVLHCRVWELPRIKKTFAISCSAISSQHKNQDSKTRSYQGRTTCATSHTGFEEGHLWHRSGFDPDPTSASITPRSLHLRPAVGLLRVRSRLGA